MRSGEFAGIMPYFSRTAPRLSVSNLTTGLHNQSNDNQNLISLAILIRIYGLPQWFDSKTLASFKSSFIIRLSKFTANLHRSSDFMIGPVYCRDIAPMEFIANLFAAGFQSPATREVHSMWYQVLAFELTLALTRNESNRQIQESVFIRD